EDEYGLSIRKHQLMHSRGRVHKSQSGGDCLSGSLGVRPSLGYHGRRGQAPAMLRFTLHAILHWEILETMLGEISWSILSHWTSRREWQDVSDTCCGGGAYLQSS